MRAGLQRGGEMECLQRRPLLLGKWRGGRWSGHPFWGEGLVVVGGAFPHGVKVDWILDFRPDGLEVSAEEDHLGSGRTGVLVD